jgi:hypothetical protein
MEAKTRMTKQGIRDLNDYGPKRAPATSVAPSSVGEAPTVPAPPAGPEVLAAVSADEENQSPSDKS